MPQLSQLAIAYQSQWFWLFLVLATIYFVVGVNALELLVGGIQAFVFALLTALYIKDAVHLH